MNSSLTNAIFNKLKSDTSAHYFLTSLMSDATVYLFGGAIRDFFDGKMDSLRDIDFVIEKGSKENVDILKYLEHLEFISYKKNRFDGYKIFFNNNITVDIWNLRDTWAFKTKKLKPSASNLMKSVYLNVDALVYSLNNNDFIDNCDISYFNTINNHLLDIVFEETPYEELNLLRALIFQKKYSLELSPRLNHRLVNYIENDEISLIDSFINLQMEHYNQVLLDHTKLANMFSELPMKKWTTS